LLRQEQPHHKAASDLIRAADSGCYICGIVAGSSVWRSMELSAEFKSIWYLAPLSGRQTGSFKLTIDAAPPDEELDSGMISEEESDDSQLDGAEDGEDTFAKPELPMWGFHLQPAAGRETWFMKSAYPPLTIPQTSKARSLSLKYHRV
jgi:hypothetical protein